MIVLTVFAARIVLKFYSVEDCVSDKCNASVIVDLKGDRQCHISNTVNVKKQKQIVNKGKNVVHLFTGGGHAGSSLRI